MRLFLLLSVVIVPILCKPEGYNKYREPAPVIEKHGLQSVLPPCKHTGGYKFDASASSLIQSQNQGRIVNQKNQYTVENNLETAASGYSSQTHAASLSNQIGSGIGGKGSTYQSSGIATSVAKPPVNYIPVSQVPPPLPHQNQAQSYVSSQGHGYNYHQGVSSHSVKQSPQINVPAVHPVPPKPGSFGAFLPSSRPQYSGQQSSHSSGQFGSQISSASNYNPSQVSAFSSSGTNFGSHNGGSNFGNQQSSGQFGVSQFGSSQLGNSQFGGSQFGGSQFGGSQFGASQFGSSLLGGHQSHGNFDTYSSSSHGADALNGQLGHVIRETVANAPLDPSADKHIYVHVPPEDLERDNDASSLAPQFIAPPKKHYKIVFIKAPTHQGPNYSQLAAAAAPKVEEKTLIYVLVKKPDQPNIEDLQQIQQTSYKNNKPEVYFIKYKTQKEGGGGSHNTAYNVGGSGTALAADQIELTTSNPIDQIDIRSGGNEGPKHDLYGVPLQ